MYGKSHTGKKKVIALKEVCNYLCGEDNIMALDVEITEEEGQWQSIIPRCDAVVVGFDNLKARRFIYEEWKVNGKDNSIFLDGRLSVEEGTIYILTTQSSEEDYLAYEGTYFEDHERVELPCTFKSTTHCGALIAAKIVGNITNWFNNITEGTMPRIISNIEFHLPLMMFDQPVLKAKEVCS